jgi:hypothetical protein
MHITDSDGNPHVFNVKRNDDGKSWLNTDWNDPDNQWNLDNEVVFRLRKYCLFPRQRGGVLFRCLFSTRSNLVTENGSTKGLFLIFQILLDKQVQI